MSWNKSKIVKLCIFIVGALGAILFAIKAYAEPSLVYIGTTLVSISGSLSVVFIKESRDFDLTLKVNRETALHWKSLRWSFNRDEYVNPRIIKELEGLLSDSGSQVTSVCLEGGNVSDKYYGRVEVNEDDGNPNVLAIDGDCIYGYTYIGTSSSGVHTLRTSQSGFGSGIFNSLIFVLLESDDEIVFDETLTIEPRVCITKVGLLALGDRFDGDIQFERNLLTITKGTRHSSTLDNYGDEISIHFA